MESYADTVSVCKRLGNTKRDFLVLNKAQCKHYPSSPSKARRMFTDLANLVMDYFGKHDVLVIGFAETATAVGAGVATYLGVDYVNTTREDFDADFIEFTESHSHAVEQKLAKPDLGKYSTVIIVEDELTTGNTAMKLIDKLTDLKPNLHFVALSILNGMSDVDLGLFDTQGIDVKYLEKIDNSDYSGRVRDLALDGKTVDIFESSPSQRIIFYSDCFNTRETVNANKYYIALYNNFMSVKVPEDKKDILVLGTEECMFPAIILGSILEERGLTVACHSTTRSPIGVARGENYPLNASYRLHSCYEYKRPTFIYNLREYDAVYIVTDADYQDWGTSELIMLLRMFGNKDIILINLGDQ